MKKTIGAIALAGGVFASAAAIALAGTTAFAETAVDDQRARLAILWGQDKAATASRSAASLTTLTAPKDPRGEQATGIWAGNHAAGRVHPPAGR